MTDTSKRAAHKYKLGEGVLVRATVKGVNINWDRTGYRYQLSPIGSEVDVLYVDEGSIERGSDAC